MSKRRKLPTINRSIAIFLQIIIWRLFWIVKFKEKRFIRKDEIPSKQVTWNELYLAHKLCVCQVYVSVNGAVTGVHEKISLKIWIKIPFCKANASSSIQIAESHFVIYK